MTPPARDSRYGYINIPAKQGHEPKMGWSLISNNAYNSRLFPERLASKSKGFQRDIPRSLGMMKQCIVILMLFAASISTVASMDFEAGNATFDLGDGYEASFMLPDIGKSYTVEDAYAESTTDNSLFEPYGFTISADGIELASLTMYVYSSPQLYPVPKASVEPSVLPETMGPRVTTPKTISGVTGYVGYDLQVGADDTIYK
jgi:hypothetical protein